MEQRTLYRSWVEVSRASLKHNTETIKKLTKPAKLMAVVKSNAYGHGLVKTAKFFLKYGADWLGVDSLKEGIELRQAGIKAPLLVLGYTPPEGFSMAARHKIKLVFYNREILQASSPFKKKIDWHLKIDTGMSRQGVLWSELADFLSLLKKQPAMRLEGVLTHFASADYCPDQTLTRQQLTRFQESLNLLADFGWVSLIKHTANTPALLNLPESVFNLTRVGIGLYGLWPSQTLKTKFAHLRLRPALSWKTKMVQVKKIPRGSTVGYGATEKVKRDTIIAVLPVGYYDGYFRLLSSRGEVLTGGQRCRILGRISMNLTVIDVTKTANPQVGQEVVLIGRQNGVEISAEELAEKAGTIGYEVVARISPLLPRIYI